MDGSEQIVILSGALAGEKRASMRQTVHSLNVALLMGLFPDATLGVCEVAAADVLDPLVRRAMSSDAIDWVGVTEAAEKIRLSLEPGREERPPEGGRV